MYCRITVLYEQSPVLWINLIERVVLVGNEGVFWPNAIIHLQTNQPPPIAPETNQIVKASEVAKTNQVVDTNQANQIVKVIKNYEKVSID